MSQRSASPIVTKGPHARRMGKQAGARHESCEQRADAGLRSPYLLEDSAFAPVHALQWLTTSDNWVLMGRSEIDPVEGARAARRALRRLLHLLRLEKEGLYLVIAYAVAIGLSSLAAPIAVQMLVSAIAFGGLIQPVVVLSLLLLVALLFAAAVRTAQAWIVERIQQRLFVRVASDLSDRLPRLSVSALDSEHGPELVNRFFDVLTVQKAAATLLLDGILVILQVIVGGTLLAFYHAALLGFAAATLLAVVGILVAFGRRGATTSLAESKAKYALVAWFEEIAHYPAIFRAVGGGRFARGRSNDLIEGYLTSRRAHYRILLRQTAGFLALQAITTAALLAIGGSLVLRGQLTLGQLVAAELILTAVVAGFAKFGKYLETYYDLIAAMDKLGQLVELPLERATGAALEDEKGQLVIQAHGVTFSHQHSWSPGLNDVSLDVNAGARIALLGPSGAGKSTLLDLLFGLRDPISGHVEIDGLPLRSLSLEALRQRVALVRGATIFDGSILDNVRMGREEIRLEQVRAALETVDLWTEISHLPDALETHLTSEGGNLSSGQAQRLAIARAIVAAPRCLLLDEALDHLDPEARRRIIERILGPEAPWSVVVATHDASVARYCSQRFVMKEGELRPLEPGPVEP